MENGRLEQERLDERADCPSRIGISEVAGRELQIAHIESGRAHDLQCDIKPEDGYGLKLQSRYLGHMLEHGTMTEARATLTGRGRARHRLCGLYRATTPTLVAHHRRFTREPLGRLSETGERTGNDRSNDQPDYGATDEQFSTP